MPFTPRSRIYKILSHCFCYPDENFLNYAKADLPKELEASFDKLPYNKYLRKSYESFRVALQQVKALSLEDWQVEYTGLFIYPSSGKLPCYPYESALREGNRCLMGESTMAVKRLYHTLGLHVSRQFADLPDHIAAELEFIHFLALNENEFDTSGYIKSREWCLNSEFTFLEGHLLRWVPKFATCLKENSDSKFFVELSQFTHNFLVAETEYLKAQRGTYDETQLLATADMEFDASTLTVLEIGETVAEPEVKWVYTTSPERYWYSPVKIKVVDGRAEQIVARDDVPFFDGKQNVRTFACFAKLYAPDKLKYPLKRVGKRGEGKFKRVSWDEALSEVAAVLNKYRDAGNAKHVAFLRTHPPLEYMFNHFTHYYGSPNDVHTSTTSCYADAEVAEVLTGLKGAGDVGKDDYLNAKYALCIGHTLQNNNRPIPSIARCAEAIRRGMKFVFVDPRLNEGSYAYGAEWVPIKPGTDAAFVLALIHVIIQKNLYDEAFLLNFTNAPILIKPDRYPLKDNNGEYLVWDTTIGSVASLNKTREPALLGSYEVKLGAYQGVCQTAFQLLVERAKAYQPEIAAGITTIPKEKIEEIARDLGIMKPHLYICSQHNVSAQYSNSLQYCRARNILMSLLGIYDKPGGKYYEPSVPDGITLNKEEDFRIPIEVHPMAKDRVDYDPTVHPVIQTKLKDYPIGIIQNVLKAIQTGKPYPIKVLFIIGCDVIASQSREWREAFQEVELIVKSHVWPDDDVDYADIVLPEAAYLERDEGFTKVTVPDPEHKDTEFSFLTVIQQVVEPQFEERAWTDYVKELAQRIGFGEYYDFTLDEYWDFLLEPMGIDIGYLRKQGVYYPTPLVTRRPEFGKKQRWTSDTGRQNIYSPELVDLWHKNHQRPLYDPLPVYHPISVEPQADNEFHLLSGKCSYFKCNFYRDNAMLLERYLDGELGNTLLWINAKRATVLGIKDRDWVWVESEATGQKDKVRVKVTEGIHPSAVWHIYGTGHKSRLMDRFSRGREGINVQDFTPQHQAPFTAGAAHCEAIVRVYKAQEKLR